MYHSTVVIESALQARLLHTIWKKIFKVAPPIIIRVTQVPPERYMVGRSVDSFPNLLPETISSSRISYFVKTVTFLKILKKTN